MSSKTIIIDKNLCFTEGYSVELILALKAISYGRAITNNTYKKGYELGLIQSYESNGMNYISLTEKGQEVLQNIELKSSEAVSAVEEDIYKEIAEEMRNLYPAGRKQGTAYMWRDTVSGIATRLKKALKANKIAPNKEKILNALKSYVDGFKGNYTYMQLLKYFILKDGESQLVAYLENEGQIEEEDKEWQTTVV